MDGETESAARVLALLESLPPRFESREWFKSELSARGLPAAIVEWLAMNVRRDGDGYALRLDLPAIRAMLVDYFGRDLWPIVRDPRSTSRLVVVVAGRSTVFDAAARQLLSEARAVNPNLSIVDLPAAGHWVHVDDPAGLLAALRAGLETGSS
jgi:pimeloyl-ACP methyl ester carboxylesterase